jgi:hypothetical protein
LVSKKKRLDDLYFRGLKSIEDYEKQLGGPFCLRLCLLKRDFQGEERIPLSTKTKSPRSTGNSTSGSLSPQI